MNERSVPAGTRVGTIVSSVLRFPRRPVANWEALQSLRVGAVPSLNAPVEMGTSIQGAWSEPINQDILLADRVNVLQRHVIALEMQRDRALDEVEALRATSQRWQRERMVSAALLALSIIIFAASGLNQLLAIVR